MLQGQKALEVALSLTHQDIADLVAFRRELHRFPELSNEEEGTARRVTEFLSDTGPTEILQHLGGHGLALIFDGTQPGPTLLFRSELDALPIQEIADRPHRSTVPGTAHMCGHDGHTAVLAALARQFGRMPPARGRVVLLFQPAEETGNGAADVVGDPRYEIIRPDFAFSLHNLPGIPFGQVRLKAGVVNCASRGLRILLEGKTAHASMPETGVSPMRALCELMPVLSGLSRGTVDDPAFSLVTVTHATMGEPVFAIAPGHAVLHATLRTQADAGMDALCSAAEALVQRICDENGLTYEMHYRDIYVASVNAPEAVEVLRIALDQEGISHDATQLPMRASEDFGLFGYDARSAMLFLGAGVDVPALHNPDYDFPDGLIEIGSRIFMRTARHLLDRVGRG